MVAQLLDRVKPSLMGSVGMDVPATVGVIPEIARLEDVKRREAVNG